MSRRNKFLWTALVVLVLLSFSCDLESTGNGGNNNSAVMDVTLSRPNVSLTVGETEILKFFIEPTTAKNKNVKWQSSKTAVATVDENGIITAVSAGITVITVTTVDRSKTDDCTVIVTGGSGGDVAVTGVTLNKASTTLTVGITEKLFVNISPTNATNQNVNWSSDKPAVASVTQDGTVTGMSVGSAEITVSTVDGNRTVKCAVSVSAASVDVTSVSLNKQNTNIPVGGFEILTAAVSPFNATNQNVTWSSSNPAVASVTNGVVVGVTVGSAVIIVSTAEGGKTAACSVSVSDTAVAVTGVSLDKTSFSLAVGGYETLTATVAPADATNKNVSWTSSNTAIATVSGGAVTGVSSGSVTITVTTVDGGRTAACTVNVNAFIVSVNFNANNGSGTVPSTQTASVGSNITLPDSSGLSRSGYAFGGWNTNTSGTGTTYRAGDSYTVTGNVTLYAKWDIATFVSVSGLANKISWLQSNAESGVNYTLEINANESIGPQTLSYSGKSNITIHLKGIGSIRIISLSSNGSMFSVNYGVTLILDENITLTGRSSNNASLVSVSGGNLIMNDGSKITGNTYSNSSYYCSGGGVYVDSGTFTMNGGEITGNTVTCNSSSYAGFGGGVYINSGTFNMHSGTISGNTSSDGGGGICIIRTGIANIHGGVISGNEGKGGYGGGGIFVFGGGTLAMYGGAIRGNTAARFGGGVYVYTGNATFAMHGGIISGNTAIEGGGGVESSNGIFKKLSPIGGQNSGIIFGSEAIGFDADGKPLKNTSNHNGHAVYGSSSRCRNTTAGETDQIDTITGRGLSTGGNPPFGQ
jgi:uncharacterized protein YjdB